MPQGGATPTTAELGTNTLLPLTGNYTVCRSIVLQVGHFELSQGV